MSNKAVKPTNQCLLAEAIRKDLGIVVEPIADGNFHRYPAPGKSARNTACWAKWSEDGRVASYGNFITGESHSWFADEADPLTDTDTVAARDTYRQRQAEEMAIKQAAAADKAKAILEAAKLATRENLYALQKRIEPVGAVTEGVALVIPLRTIDGAIRNVQYVYPDCSKQFLKGGQVKGLFAVCGSLFSTDKLFVCEGYATAATVHEVTGHCTVAAMSAGNLLAVCVELARVAPMGVEIIVAADNDHRTEGNPGLTKAKEAAQHIGASLVIPPLPCGAGACRCTDFNDWENCCQKLMVEECHG